MITGSITIIIRAAPSATSTTAPTTMISRRATAEATARPRGTASSPLSSRRRPLGTAVGRARLHRRGGHDGHGLAAAGAPSNAGGYRGRPMPALIFDLDGTLVDTVYAHVFAWQRALARCGLRSTAGGSTGGSA